MSTYKCPECGSPINLNERHCANCDYDVTDAEYAGVAPQPVAPHAEKPQAPQMPTPQSPASTAGIDSIMAHGNVDVSTHHSEDKSTHNIDNSQTVNNTNQTVTNTFIIMGGGPAPIPQNIDPQTAEALKQVQQMQQPAQPVQPVQPAAQPSQTNEAHKGVGSIDGRRGAGGTEPKKNKTWIVIAAIAAVAVVAVLALRPSHEEAETTPAPVEQTFVSTKKTAPATSKQTTTTSQTTTATTTTKATANTAAKPQATNAVAAVEKPKDANYESGMKAYKSGDGLAAVQAFKASGSKESLRMLGKIYEEGCGSIEANAMMARKYYKEAENK